MNFLKRTAVSKIVSRGTTPKAGATIYAKTANEEQN